jgi:hypothetical protein
VFLGARNDDNYSGSLIVVGREGKSRFEGDESASYAASDDTTSDISFIDSDVFWIGSEASDHTTYPMF